MKFLTALFKGEDEELTEEEKKMSLAERIEIREREKAAALAKEDSDNDSDEEAEDPVLTSDYTLATL